MALFGSDTEILSFSSALILLLLNAHNTLGQHVSGESGDDPAGSIGNFTPLGICSILDADKLATSAVHNFRLCTVFYHLDVDLGFWIKPHTTSFSRFLLNQYGEERWIQMFRMTKTAVFALSDLLKPHVQKHDTKYRWAIPVFVRLVVTLFKLTHGASLFIYSEMFAVGRSTCSFILRETVRAINDCLCHEVKWPSGEKLLSSQSDFQALCGLPAIVGAIDGTHITIAKPRYGVEDYYYFKSRDYTLNRHTMVDSNKKNFDPYLGMPGSTNDSRVLQRSSCIIWPWMGILFIPIMLLMASVPTFWMTVGTHCYQG